MDEIKKESLQGELYFYRTIFTVVDLVSNSFYYILLYKTTGEFAPLFIDLIIYFLAQWVGIIIGNILIPRLGYIKTFKLSFLVLFIGMILLVLNLGNLALIYPLFSILRAFPRGIFWSVNNNYLIRELSSERRGKAISDIASITYVMQILLPVLIGATVSLDGNYSILFLITASISLVTLIIPWKYNKKPRTNLTMPEVNKILSDKKFKKLAWLLLIGSGFDANIALCFAIVPFLFLKSEFGVGILLTVINLLAAIFAFMQRSKKSDEVKKTSYFGVSLTAIFNTILALLWSFPALILRSVLSTIGESLYLPVLEKLDLSTRKKILGSDLNQSSAEMAVIAETIFTIGRITALSFFLMLVILLHNDESVFKIIIFLDGIWFFVFLSGLYKVSGDKSKTVDFDEKLVGDISDKN